MKKFKIHGIENYNVIKSDYNEETKKFDFELAHDGVQLEVSLSQKSQLNLSSVALDSKIDHDLTISGLPGTLKLEWTFGSNENQKVMAKDYKFSLEPLKKGVTIGEAIRDLENHYKVNLDMKKMLGEDEEIKWNDFVAKRIFEMFNKFLSQFESVEELASKLSLPALEDFDPIFKDEKNCVNVLAIYTTF